MIKNSCHPIVNDLTQCAAIGLDLLLLSLKINESHYFSCAGV
jgi:hypothetical protein